MPTMKDIAEYSQVSLATVSRVLHGSSNVSIEKRKRVMEWVKKLDYQPNASAQGLAGARSFLIGVLLPDISNPYFAEILSQMEDEASHMGYSILISNTRGDKSKIRETINVYKARQVDGILLCIDPRETALLEYTAQKNIPAVSFTQPSSVFDSIFISLEKGGALIAQHLIDLGHEKIAYIGEINDPKFIGFQHHLNKYGVKVSNSNIIELDGWENLSNKDITERVIKFYESRIKDVSAIFVFNDITAIQVMQCLMNKGVRIPEDIALIGFDNITLARKFHPTLSTVGHPTKEIGRLALETLLRRIDNKNEGRLETISLEPRLIVRESSHRI